MTQETPRPPGPNDSEAVRAMADPVSAPWFMAEVERTYPSIAHMVLHGEHTYALTDPQAIVEVFIEHGRHTMKGNDLKGVEVDGSGPDTEGEFHMRHRRLAQPAFNRERLIDYSTQMTALTLEQERTWHDGETIDMQQSMAAMSLSIMGRTLFGVDLSGDSHSLGDTAAALMTALGTRMLLPDSPGVAVEERARGDMLSLLLALQDEGFGFTDAAGRNSAINALLGDPEPTAMNLSWSWLLLGQHPEWAAWLHEELEVVLGGADARIDDMDRLPRTRAVLAESMRLYPPAWIEGRRLLEDVEINGWLLPAGSLAFACQFAMHRSERWWSRPHEFWPQRWINDDGDFDEEAPGQPRGAWFPFGWGSRRCIGERFAWTEATLVLATLAQRWSPQPLSGTEVVPVGALTLRARDGMPMVLRRR